MAPGGLLAGPISSIASTIYAESLGIGTVQASLELASARMACWQAGLSMADELAAITKKAFAGLFENYLDMVCRS